MRDRGTLRPTPIVAERSGINLYAEHSLHAQLKEYLAGPGDRLEVPIGGRVIDLVKADGELVEVQTGNLGKIVPKALALVGSGHRVRVVYPIAAEREIHRLDPKTAELLSVRRSPKRGDVFSLFDELVMAAGLVASRNVTIEALLIKTAEVKTRDGSGSWWRRGDRTVDRELLEVLSSRSFRTPGQWLSIIPEDLLPPWTSSSLGEALEIGPDRARKILYCLARAGLLVEVDKDGRSKAYKASKARRGRP